MAEGESGAPSESDRSSDSPHASCLGTHAHWEATYAAELGALREDGDEGEVWFGARVNRTVADWVTALAPPAASPAVLDVGCGNGALLFALASRGHEHLTGSDYSGAGLALARAVAAARGGPAARVAFVLDDVTATTLPHASFDVVTDKGTLDAIGLSAEGVAARGLYRSSVAALLKPGGLLVLTCVNSTADELVAEFAGGGHGGGQGNGNEGGAARERAAAAAVDAADTPAAPPPLFTYVDRVRTYPTLAFGGATGARVATAAFRRA